MYRFMGYATQDMGIIIQSQCIGIERGHGMAQFLLCMVNIPMRNTMGRAKGGKGKGPDCIVLLYYFINFNNSSFVSIVLWIRLISYVYQPFLLCMCVP